jgi:hypothetical protein
LNIFPVSGHLRPTLEKPDSKGCSPVSSFLRKCFFSDPCSLAPFGMSMAFFPRPSCLRRLLAGEGRKSFKFFGLAHKPPQRPPPFDSDRISAPNVRRYSVNGCLLSMAARRSSRLASATAWHKIRADVLLPIQEHCLLHGRRILSAREEKW